MSSIQVDVRFDRADKTYRAKDLVTGEVTIVSKSEVKHDGIKGSLEGTVKLHPTKAGVFDSLTSDIKPLMLITAESVLVPPGKLSAGTSRFPFKFLLELPQGSSKTLQETYHGVHIAVQYFINVNVKRSFPNKDVEKSAEFLFEVAKPSTLVSPRPVQFEITPESVKVGKSFPRSKLPKFLISGTIDSDICILSEPFSGEICIQECSQPIKSIELQLVRIECVGSDKDALASDATEIQNIQIGEGDVCRNLPISIHMVFPRLFTCPSVKTPSFSVDFEVNIVVVFDDPSGHFYQLAENFPIILRR